MHHLSKRLCAILLTLCMVIGFLPMTTRAALVDSSSYVSQQLTLADEFVLHLLSDNIPEAYQSKGHAELTYPMGKDGNKVTKTYRIEDVTINDRGYYDLPVERVVAQMADDIELVVKSDDLGVEVIKQTYSIRKYAEALINGLYTRQTKDLCYEMLNYGAWAQKYFDYNTDNLANEGYEIQPGYDISDAAKRDVNVTGDLESIKVYGATVVFLSEAAVRFYFATANDIKNYTFSVNGAEYTPRAKSGYYYIEVSGINPQEMEAEMYVEVTDGVEDLSFTYAPIDFFVRSYHNSTDDTYKGLLAAAYSYYSAAKAFAGNSITGAIELDLVYYSGDNNSLTVQTDLAYAAGMTVNSATGDWSTGISQTQEASTVAIANQDSKASLTFEFANAFSVGDTYSLSKGMAFVINNQEYVLNEDYVFQLAATGESAYKWNTVEPVATGNKLLGFENYTQITGADTGVKLSVGNMLGRMELNTDRKYVSEGVASLKVQPQGDYSNPGKHPYIKLDMSGVKNTAYNGTISGITSHADFSGYKSISFDVYNPENEAQEIRAGLMIGADSYISTNKQKFTLAPNSWTTCTYDLSVMAGFPFYELDSERFVIIEFLDHKETKDDVPPVLYIDDLVANNYQDGESSVDTVYNYRTGIDFEAPGLEYLFIGQGNIERDAAIERVRYADAGISGPADGGSYGLKLSHDSNRFPTFRIHFGEPLPAGTAVSFDAYSVITGGTYTQDLSLFEFSNAAGGTAGEATDPFSFGTWTELTFTLNADAAYVDLFWNIERAGITPSTASGEVYIDNVKVVTNITPEGNILDGLSFEEIGNTAYFSSTSSTVRRMPYASLGIDAPTGGDQYALEVTQSGETATVTISFGGQTLAAGTVISFKALVTHNSGTILSSKELSSSNGTVAPSEPSYDVWTDVTVTLASAATEVTLKWNANYWWGVNSVSMYIDNIKAVEPAGNPSGSFRDGIGFEVKENAYYFEGQPADDDMDNYQDFSIRRVAYSELTGITAPADGGDYALKLSHTNDRWPTFRVNFGETLTAGTVIAFQVYVEIDGMNNTNVTKFEYTETAEIAKGTNATELFACNTWHTVTMTLPVEAAYVDLFLNVAWATGENERSSQVYLDNFVVVSGDFESGVNFETVGNTGLFTGQGAADDAVLARVSYANLNIGQPTNGGGTYALKLSNAASDQRYPKFRVNFGKTLPVGTVITFDAYGRITNGANSYNQSIFEYSAGGEATAQFKCDAWTELTITLKEETDHLDLFWNFDRAGFGDGVTEVSAEVYLDNFLAEVPVDPEGDFLEGVGFEVKGNIGLFTGTGSSKDATIKRVTYADANVTAPANGGTYALKVSHASNCWPEFRVNFGKTLKAGTVITFDVYGNYESDTTGTKYMKLELTGDSKSFATSADSDQVLWTVVETWRTGVTITLTADSDHVDFFYNVADGQHGEVSSWLLLDNFLAVEPIVTEGDFLEGVGFEVAGNIGLFTAVGGDYAGRDATIQRFAYTDDIEAPNTDSGDYALELTHASNRYPTFRINLGEILPAGTTLTFNAYVEYLTDGDGAVSVIEPVDKTVFAETAQFGYQEWVELSITLLKETDYIDLFWNMNRSSETATETAQTALYLDNFQAAVPADFLAGVDFETVGHENSFTGTNGGQAATVERVSYADANVAAPANGGSYALKLSHTSNSWPWFRIDFGKTLPAGTVITFDAYGNYEFDTTDTKYIKIELSPDSKNYATSADPNQVLWTVVETWRTGVTITLTAECDHLELFWNVADGNHGDSLSSWLLLDNIKATVPEDEAADFEAGVTFEKNGHQDSFTGITDGVTIQRVSYANLGIDSNGRGDYALALSHDSNCWPNFRINFGKTLPAGTTITFDAYGNYDGDAVDEGYKYIKVELTADAKNNYAASSDTNQVIWTVAEEWKASSTITLTADSDHLDLFWNVADGRVGEVPSVLLLDNIKATLPEMAFIDGVTFEEESHVSFFTGVGGDNEWRDATFEVVSFDGDNALKLTCASSQWPTFRINFGRTLAAGTVIYFDAYTNDTSGIRTTVSIFEVIANCTETAQYYHGSWNNLSTTLTTDCDHIDLMCNMDRWNEPGPANLEVYLDNFYAVEPIGTSLSFEFAYQDDYFTGTGGGNDATIERVSYADLGIEGPSDGGEYALKLSRSSAQIAYFRINFGRTMPAGTTIKLDAYNMTAGDHLAMYFDSPAWGDAYWKLNGEMYEDVTLATTISSDCSYVDLYMEPQNGSDADFYIVIDNIQFIEP